MSRKVAILTPIRTGEVHHAFASSLARTIQKVRDWEIAWFTCIGNSILPDARSELVAQALQWGADQVVFIDDDISWTVEDFRFLCIHPVSVCTGVYMIRPNNLDNWEEKKLSVKTLVAKESNEHGLVEVGGAGFGFIRIDAQVFREVDVQPLQFHGESPLNDFARDWFAYRKTPEMARVGEDFSFCMASRDAGHPVWMDPQIRLGHHAGALCFEVPEGVSTPSTSGRGDRSRFFTPSPVRKDGTCADRLHLANQQLPTGFDHPS